ncbi:MAG: hypothetical protein IPI34_00690 [bacterium]|nr:hypothetical protein [bacterium]
MPISKHHASLLSAFTVLVALCAAAGPASGFIVAHWRFDEPSGSSIAVDETGGFDGQMVGGAEFGAPPASRAAPSPSASAVRAPWTWGTCSPSATRTSRWRCG